MISCIIPVKDLQDEKLSDLIDSIHAQNFPREEIEILTITEGDSEQAKAAGIRQAKGEICAMFCADNYITDPGLFSMVSDLFQKFENIAGIYSKFYQRMVGDNSLNRYFALIGNNDPIPFYLGKCDRKPQYENDPDELFTIQRFHDDIPSLGDNGFFYRKSFLLKTDLDHYYPMDNAADMVANGHATFLRYNCAMIWHRTSDNLISFLMKRYRYARDLYCDRNDRRWKMLSSKQDYFRLTMFMLATLFCIEPLYISGRGFLKIRDAAWFWHLPVCFGFLITYTILAVRNCLKSRSLFRPFSVQRN